MSSEYPIFTALQDEELLLGPLGGAEAEVREVLATEAREARAPPTRSPGGAGGSPPLPRIRTGGVVSGGGCGGDAVAVVQ